MNFFIPYAAIPATVASGHYDVALVLLSFAIATIAAYVALTILLQITPGNDRSRKRGCILGALVMGTGIWSMHFTGMLAFKMDMVHSYHLGLTTLSMAIAALFSWAVFYNITSKRLTWWRIVLNAPLMGIGIASMHYIGMAAMQMEGDIRYIAPPFWTSIGIAIVISAIALWMMRRVSDAIINQQLWHIGTSIVLGLAVCGMHYTGMVAAVFLPYATCRFDSTQDHSALVGCVLMANVAVVFLALFEMSRDIANRKITEERLQKYAIELEQARARAEQATEEKSQFVASISHELRTPMNGILGMVYLLGDTPLNPLQRDYINTINHSAQNLLLLINDVLDMSKIEAGELIIEKTPFDIKTDFVQTINLLKSLALNKGIALLYTIDSAMPDRVISDHGHFIQIITNLIGNAIKFTEAGKVEANLRYDAANHSIHCVVKDTGIGIPEGKREVIFEKFVQGDVSITRKYGGTGLGLAITKRLIMMLGGEIGFDSQVNVGSRFWFTLPVALPDWSSAQRPNAAIALPDTRLIKADMARVLIAEDNAINQMFLLAILKKFGFDAIDVTENGVQVMEKIERGSQYHAIFMDCRMPEMDGYEATRLIREREQKADKPVHIPIIAMTANALSGDREACLKAGMDEYLSKPLQPDRLKDVLKRWFLFSSDAELLPRSSANTENAIPSMDFERLKLVAETDADKASVLAIFFRAAKELVATMQNARRGEEFPQWKNAAHSLKGSAANLGMTALENVCRQAEKAADISYDRRTILLTQIKDEIERIKAYVIRQNPALLPPEI